LGISVVKGWGEYLYFCKRSSEGLCVNIYMTAENKRIPKDMN